MLDQLCEKFARERGIDLKREPNYKDAQNEGVEISYLLLSPTDEALIIEKCIECEVAATKLSATNELLLLIRITQGFLSDYLAMLSRSENEFNREVLMRFEPYLYTGAEAAEQNKEIFIDRSPDNLVAVVNCIIPPIYTKVP